MNDKKVLTYKDAGVNIDAGDEFAMSIRNLAKQTFKPEVLSEIGGFGGLFHINKEKYRNPVIVTSTDGVGTKLRVAFMMNRHDTVGIDLVAMCVNDIIVQGAEPLFMLDYISTGKINKEILLDIMKGIVKGCLEAGAALIGGETAEMPSFFKEGEYDLVGFVVGIVERDNIIDGSSITVGDKIVGIQSNGMHSNGFSLARKVFFERLSMKTDDYVEEFGHTLGEELLRPTRIYAKTINNILRDFEIHGIAHITGGGFTTNIPRILPKGCMAYIDTNSWYIPPVFSYLQHKGNIDQSEMLRTFNNGIGMVLIVPSEYVEDIILRLKGLNEKAHIIGEVVEKKGRGESIKFL